MEMKIPPFIVSMRYCDTLHRMYLHLSEETQLSIICHDYPNYCAAVAPETDIG